MELLHLIQEAVEPLVTDRLVVLPCDCCYQDANCLEQLLEHPCEEPVRVDYNQLWESKWGEKRFQSQHCHRLCIHLTSPNAIAANKVMQH
eukprot:9143773-Ditylum_brightwellii.AAC.1